MKIEVPATKDVIQEFRGNLEVPEIRVWCHPHYIDQPGSDYYRKFRSFEKALEFIKSHPEAEKHPLVAMKGYEMNLFAIEELKKDS